MARGVYLRDGRAAYRRRAKQAKVLDIKEIRRMH